MSERPDFFTLLDLDPDAPWDAGHFEKVLKEKRAYWAKRSRIPRYRREYRSYIEMTDQIREVMTDEDKRSDEARRAKRAQADQEKEILAQFEQILQDMSASTGELTDDQVTHLISHYGDDLSEARIRQLIRQQGLTVVTTGSGTAEAPAELDKSTLADIERELQVLNKDSLYDFLGMRPSVSLEMLHQRAGTINAEARKEQKTEASSARQKLAGYASDIFDPDDDKRAAYDYALANKVYDRLQERVKQVLVGKNPVLTKGQFDHFLQQARQDGLDIERAQQAINEVVRMRKATVDMSDTESLAQQIRCPTCQTLNDPKNTYCRTCSTELWLNCPSCQKKLPVTDSVCGACGFPIGNLTLVDDLLQEAGHYINENNYTDALKRLQEARSAWSLPDNTLADDTRSRTIRQRLNDVSTEVMEARKKRARLQTALNNNRYYEARDILQTLNAAAAELTDEKQQVHDAIRQAEKEVQRIERLGLEPDEAVKQYRAILSQCADCKPALAALAKLPPNPPQNLTAHRRGGTVELTWQRSSSDAVQYQVVRRPHTRPTSPTDGTALTTVSGTTFDDASPPTGVPVFYAVYTVRDGIHSTGPARLNDPIQLTPPVQQATIQKEIHDRAIQLQWQLPPAVDDVIVRRSDREFPRTTDEGRSCPLVTSTELLDDNLTNNTIYYYSIFCRYRDHHNNWLTSEPATVRATPQRPPDPITDLHISSRSSDDSQVHLTWTAPDKGRVAILQTDSAPPVDTGQTLTESRLQSYGTLLQTTGHSLTVSVNAGKSVYFVPLVLLDGTAIVGEAVRYSNIPGVTDLTVQNHDRVLQVRWTWPPYCSQALLAYSYSGYPTLDGDTVVADSQQEVTRAEYDRRGYAPIFQPEGDTYYIAVFAIVEQQGETLISSPARTRLSIGSVMTVHYEVQQERQLFGLKRGDYHLHLTVKGSGRLPAWQLVARANMPPRRASDGEVLLQQGAMDCDGEITDVYPLPDRHKSGQQYVRLFLLDDSHYVSQGGHVRIYNPDVSKASLS